MPLRGVESSRGVPVPRKTVSTIFSSAPVPRGIPQSFMPTPFQQTGVREEMRTPAGWVYPAASPQLLPEAVKKGDKVGRGMSEQSSSLPHSLPSPPLSLLLYTSAIFLPPCLLEDSFSTFKSLFTHPLTCEISLCLVDYSLPLRATLVCSHHDVCLPHLTGATLWVPAQWTCLCFTTLYRD